MMMNLSKNFTLEELYYSPTAIRKGIDNYPPPEAIDNLRILSETILEPILLLVGGPISVQSGYRRLILNSIIGGSPSSEHIPGRAADINRKGLTVEELYQKIKASDIPFNQLIQEFNSWVHVSWFANPKRQSLRATKDDKGRTIYSAD